MPSFRSTGSLFATILLLLPVLPLTLAQQTILDFSTGALPTCAEQCPALTNAQTACIGSDAGIQPCFCRSAYLVTLYQSSTGVCDAVCQPAQLSQIQEWYLRICYTTPAEVTGEAPAVTVTEPAATVTIPPTSTATGAASRPASAAGSGSGSW